jgi:hypothetical protein
MQKHSNQAEVGVTLLAPIYKPKSLVRFLFQYIIRFDHRISDLQCDAGSC